MVCNICGTYTGSTITTKASKSLSIYRAVEDRSVGPSGSLDIEERSPPGLGQRLKQIERSLQNLQRQLHSDTPSTVLRKRRRDGEEGDPPPRFRPSSTARPGLRTGTEAFGTTESSVELPPDNEYLQASDNEDEPVVGPNTDNEVLREFISNCEQFKGFLDALPAEPPIGSAVPLWASPSEEWKFRQYRQVIGERILKDFPPKAMCEDLLRIYFRVFNHIRPCVPQHWADRALQEIFEIDGRTEVVESTSNTVGIIEAHPSEGPSPCREPPSLVSWNTIGTLAAMFAIAAFTAPQLLDADLLHFYTRAHGVHNFALRMRKVVGMCWELQKPTEYADESTILLLYNYLFMLIVFGDYSKDIHPL